MLKRTIRIFPVNHAILVNQLAEDNGKKAGNYNGPSFWAQPGVVSSFTQPCLHASKLTISPVRKHARLRLYVIPHGPQPN